MHKLSKLLLLLFLGKKKGGSTKQTLPGFMCSAMKSSDLNPSAIRWLNEEEKIFLIVKPKTIAELWGARKGNPKMNYPSMSRGIRYDNC